MPYASGDGSMDARLREMRAQGLSLSQIGARFGVAYSTIAYHLTGSRRRRAVSDVCHGACGRWVARYRVGRQIVEPPDYCGACARPLTPEAIEHEERELAGALQRIKAALSGMVAQ